MPFACYIRFTCVFLRPEQDFVVVSGCLVDRDQRSPVLCALLFSYKCRKYLFSLVQLCDLLLIFFFALLCYYAHSNVCKYIVSLNTNVSLLLFSMCLLSQVLVFDPVRVGRI